MKKVILTVLCCLFMASAFVMPVNASTVTTSYSVSKLGGSISLYLNSSDTSKVVATFSQWNPASSYSGAYFVFKIPASSVSADSVISIDSTYLGSFKAEFFYSSYDLIAPEYWVQSGTIHNEIVDFPADCFISMVGDLTTKASCLQFTYPAEVNQFNISDYKDVGYYYITGYTVGYWDASLMQLIVESPEPDPTPTPSPAVSDFGVIGSASAELGTFGTDDGTQNDVWSSFKRLYDSLYDIVTNEDTPDLSYLDAYDGFTLSVCDAGALAEPVAYADVIYDWDNDGTGDDYDASGVSFKALLDKWRANEGVTVYPAESWIISPYSVEIAETSPTRGEGYRDGNSYVINYRMRIPIRFIYTGHTGTALSNPQFSFNLDIAYSGDTTTVQYGEPSFYIDSDDISYDRMLSLVTSDGGISGDVSVALFNVPVIDAYSQYSYDLILEFPLYITEVNSPLVLPNAVQYESTVTLNSFTYNQEIEFIHLSDTTTDQTLQDIANEQKKQNNLDNERYEQEQDTINQATSSMAEGVTSVTGTLSTWEILTLPVTVMKDFINAITSTSNAQFTFPSFSLMGETLWPSYTFDLNLVSEKFPLLCNSLHLISGILIVIWFLHYLWTKWAVITGDNLPDE